MLKKSLETLAEELQADLDSRVTRRIFAEGRGPNSVDEAYQLQRALRTIRENRGEKVVGFKIGFTSAAIRRRGGVRLSDYRILCMVIYGGPESHHNGSKIDYRRLGIEG